MKKKKVQKALVIKMSGGQEVKGIIHQTIAEKKRRQKNIMTKQVIVESLALATILLLYPKKK